MQHFHSVSRVFAQRYTYLRLSKFTIAHKAQIESFWNQVISPRPVHGMEWNSYFISYHVTSDFGGHIRRYRQTQTICIVVHTCFHLEPSGR